MRLFKLLMVLLITAFAVGVASAHASTIKRTHPNGYVKNVLSDANFVVVLTQVVNFEKLFTVVNSLNESNLTTEREKDCVNATVTPCYKQTDLYVSKRTRTVYDPGTTAYSNSYKCLPCKHSISINRFCGVQYKPPLLPSFFI